MANRVYDPKFAVPPPCGQILSHRVRLVYPFQIKIRDRVPHCINALQTSGAWTTAKLNEEFRKEMQEEASSFVFGAGRNESVGYYLRESSGALDIPPNTRGGRNLSGPLFGCFADGDDGAAWLYNPIRRQENKTADARARPGGVGREFRYRVDLTHGAEIFLNSFGSGILTVSLLRDIFPQFSEDAPTPWGELLDFVYHLSHVKYRVPMNWRIEENSTADSLVQLETLPPGVANAGAAIKYFELNGLLHPDPNLEAKSANALTAVRTPGAPFTWGAVFAHWLAPIQSEIEGEQGQFMMYSVVEFPADGANFASNAAAGYEEALVSMAELEEGSHAPVARAEAATRIERLTERHLAAATPMGVAHFVSQQPENSQYNRDRAQRLLVKYFASTLAAYFQWIGLNHYQRRAVAVLGWDSGSQIAVGKLADELSWFVAAANLTIINRRDSHNRFYERLRRAYRTEAGMLALHRTIRDLGRSLETHQQSAALQLSHDALGRLNETQKLLHLTQKDLHHSEQRQGNLELFIVLVYVVEMAHVLGQMTDAKHGYSLTLAIIGTLTALLLVSLIVKKRPAWLHTRLDENRLVPIALVCLLVYFAALLAPALLPPLHRKVPETESPKVRLVEAPQTAPKQ